MCNTIEVFIFVMKPMSYKDNSLKMVVSNSIDVFYSFYFFTKIDCVQFSFIIIYMLKTILTEIFLYILIYMYSLYGLAQFHV